MEGDYDYEERITLASAPGLRVRRLTLAKSQCVPWHYHSNITDTFFCMKGPMSIRTRDPESETILQPGETLEIPPGRVHYASGVDHQPCQFMLVQGVGLYDYQEV